MAVTVNPRETARKAVLGGVRLGRRVSTFRRSTHGQPLPPDVPRGWHIAAPDFVGVGASGAATAWWHSQIERHPNVHRLPSAARELRWFERFWSEPFTSADAARYAEWFPRPEGGTAGEWTPSYLTEFWVPEMLAAAAPKARILVLLRDPVTRYAALRARAAAAASGRSPTADPWDDRAAIGAFQRGLYAEPLRRLLSVFPKEQVLILQEEACRADPDAELARTLAFIGLNPAALAPPAAAPSADAHAPLPETVRAALVEACAPDLALLAGLGMNFDLGLWTAARGVSVPSR